VVATDDSVIVFDASAQPRETNPAGPGIVAVAGVDDVIVVGYRDGHVARLAGDGLPFDDTPNAIPTTIIGGPGDSVIVGYGSGQVGMWPITGGGRLLEGRLHGSVRHLRVVDQHMHTISDLGGTLSWNLEAFYRPKCDLLRTVWRSVAVVWAGGRAVVRAPPANHPCMADPRKVDAKPGAGDPTN